MAHLPCLIRNMTVSSKLHTEISFKLSPVFMQFNNIHLVYWAPLDEFIPLSGKQQHGISHSFGINCITNGVSFLTEEEACILKGTWQSMRPLTEDSLHCITNSNETNNILRNGSI